jgi:hypothetical protein
VIFASDNNLSSAEYRELKTNFIKKIKSRDYLSAKTAFESTENKYLGTLQNLIFELLNDANNNVIKFAAFLTDKDEYLKYLFPREINYLFQKNTTMLMNRAKNLPLKLERSSTAGDNDYYAFAGYGSPISRRSWIFLPQKQADTTYFFLENIAFSVPLKLGRKADDDGDYYAYGGEPGGDSTTGQKLWDISAQRVSGTDLIYFTLKNVAHGVPLKAGWSSDSDNDYQVFGGRGSTDDIQQWSIIGISM